MSQPRRRVATSNTVSLASSGATCCIGARSRGGSAGGVVTGARSQPVHGPTSKAASSTIDGDVRIAVLLAEPRG